MTIRSKNLSNPLQRQRGLSFIAIFVIVLVVVFLGMFSFKVGPHYLEYNTVKTIAEDASGRDDLMRSKSKMNTYLQKAFRTNNLWDMEPENTIQITKDKKKGLVLTVAYEKRANLIYNIDLVTHFNTPVGTGN